MDLPNTNKNSAQDKLFHRLLAFAEKHGVCEIDPSFQDALRRWPEEASGSYAFEADSDCVENLFERGSSLAHFPALVLAFPNQGRYGVARVVFAASAKVNGQKRNWLEPRNTLLGHWTNRSFQDNNYDRNRQKLRLGPPEPYQPEPLQLPNPTPFA